MSEPCKHEREFAGTQRDTLTSFIKTSGELVKVTAERNEARTEVEKQKDRVVRRTRACQKAADARDDALATIAKVRALLGDHDGALWAVRGVREADIRAALDPTEPKGKP